MHDTKFLNSLIAELSVLQEINSFNTVESLDQLTEEVSERASRLLGCRRFALLFKEGKQQIVVGSWGFRNDEQVLNLIETENQTVFAVRFVLDENKLGIAVFEQSTTIDEKQKKLYTILSSRIQEIVASYQNIRAKKEAEEALIKSRTFFNNILNSVQEGICVLDNDFNIQYSNKVIEKYFADVLPLFGKKCYTVFYSRETPCEDCPSLKSMNSGSAESLVMPGFPDSSMDWIKVFSSPLISNEGKFIGIVESIHDITIQRKLEEDLNQIQT